MPKLRAQIIWMILLTFVAMGVFEMVSTYMTVGRITDRNEDEFSQTLVRIEKHFGSLQKHILATAKSLAEQPLVRQNVSRRNFEPIYNTALQFQNVTENKIIFLNQRFEVLARSFDEYRFDDILNVVTTTGQVNSFDMDGDFHIGTLREIRKMFSDEVTGYVVVARRIDQGIIDQIAVDYAVNVEVLLGEEKLRSFKNKGKEWVGHQLPIVDPNRTVLFDLTLYLDTAAESRAFVLHVLQRILLVGLVYIGLIIFIYRFLGHHVIKPIANIVRFLESYDSEVQEKLHVSHANYELYSLSNSINKLGKRLFDNRKSLKKALVELSSEKEKLEQDNTLLRMLSHDVANPLAVIKGKAQLALHRPDRVSNMEHFWRDVHKASESIQSILENVKKLLAVQSGKTAMELEPVQIDEIVENAQFIFEKPLSQKSMKIVLDEHSRGAMFYCDRSAFLNHVFNNIVSNAIKFSDDNSIVYVATNYEKEWVHIRVRDYGVGMPHSVAVSLFDPSARTSRTGTHGEMGTGFGMPVCKAYIDFFGGRIAIESWTKEERPSDHGTLFHIYLRRADSEEDQMAS